MYSLREMKVFAAVTLEGSDTLLASWFVHCTTPIAELHGIAPPYLIEELGYINFGNDNDVTGVYSATSPTM